MGNQYDGIMFPVKTTVVEGCGPTCRVRHEAGQVWFMRSTPPGICSFAFNAIFPAYWTLRFGGIDPGESDPDDEELRRFDKRRKNKKVSNEEWVSPTDPDARIGKMKDGRTHLKYKAENAIDLDTEIIVSAEVYHGDYGDADHRRHGHDGPNAPERSGNRLRNRGSSGRQGLPQRGLVRSLAERVATADLHSRTRAEDESQVEEQAVTCASCLPS